jgi:uncharacterized protein (DUF1330 family)
MVYVIAQLTIHDRARYDRYVAGFMAVLRRFGGRLLASDEAPEVVEGSWDGDKIVLLSFADRAAYEAWASSPEYQSIAEDRIAASAGPILVVRGFDPRLR